MLKQKQISSSEPPFQPSEVARSSSQMAAAASSCSTETDVETLVPVPNQGGHTAQYVERSVCLPSIAVCRLKIRRHCHLLPPAKHVIMQLNTAHHAQQQVQ